MERKDCRSEKMTFCSYAWRVLCSDDMSLRKWLEISGLLPCGRAGSSIFRR